LGIVRRTIKLERRQAAGDYITSQGAKPTSGGSNLRALANYKQRTSLLYLLCGAEGVK